MWGLPHYLNCDDCGAQVLRVHAASHNCDPKAVVEYQARGEIDKLDEELTAWFATNEGRFDQYDAERRR